MLRPVAGGVFLAGLAGLALFLSATSNRFDQARAEPAAQDAAKPRADADRKDNPVTRLMDKLAQPVNLDDGLDAKTPLSDALQFLTDKFDVPIWLDVAAFKDIGVEDPDNQQVRLRRMKSVRLGTILQRLLNQVNGTYLLRPDGIEATTWAKVRMEIWGQSEAVPEASPLAALLQSLQGTPGVNIDRSDRKLHEAAVQLLIKAQAESAQNPPSVRLRPLLPLVHMNLESRPLPEALAELSRATGISIVLDTRRTGDHGRAVVSAQFLNTPLDTVVRLLANQAELGVALMDNILVVTTPENAKALTYEQGKANQNGLDESGHGGAGPAAM